MQYHPGYGNAYTGAGYVDENVPDFAASSENKTLMKFITDGIEYTDPKSYETLGLFFLHFLKGDGFGCLIDCQHGEQPKYGKNAHMGCFSDYKSGILGNDVLFIPGEVIKIGNNTAYHKLCYATA